MPFYRWNQMTRQNLGKPSDSEGSIVIGDYVTLNRSVAGPGRKVYEQSRQPWDE